MFRLWIRKDNMKRTDGADKRITNGTNVTVLHRDGRDGSFQLNKSDVFAGKVWASSVGFEFAAKKATGTTAAMLVEFAG